LEVCAHDVELQFNKRCTITKREEYNMFKKFEKNQKPPRVNMQLGGL
jgi:hypothetical protein